MTAPTPSGSQKWADLDDDSGTSPAPKGADTAAAKDVADKLKKMDLKEDAEGADGDDDEAAPQDADFAPQESGIDPADKTAQVEISGGESGVYKSVSSFKELGIASTLLDGVYAMGFNTPSKIQAQALPIVLDSKHPNLIGQAHHGSGKTATYSLAMLSRIDETKEYPQALCVCPVRELANQVHQVVTDLAKFTKIKSFCAVAGSKRNDKIKEQVVIGTPGTIIAKIRHKEFDARKIVIFVVDEADVMLSKQGQGDNTLKVKGSLPRDCQILLFSATYAEKVRAFAAKTAPNATKIVIKRQELSLSNISQFYVEVPDANSKYQLLTEIYAMLDVGQTIIFVHTRATAKTLSTQMRAEGFKVSLLHGADMDPKDRDKVMDDFRKGVTTVLITTNVLARGIDVPAVNMVINYELPLDKFNRPDPDTYIHRIGRAGRFGRKGVAITFVHDKSSKEQLLFIANYFQKDVKKLPNNIDELSGIVKKCW